MRYYRNVKILRPAALGDTITGSYLHFSVLYVYLIFAINPTIGFVSCF